MRKGILVFLLSTLFFVPTLAATNYIPKQFSNVNTGEGLYPYSLNNRRQQQITTTNKSVSVPKVGDGTSPMQSTGKRGVVKRSVPARAASSSSSVANNSSRRVVPRHNIGRSATNNRSFQGINRNQNTGNRGVVARSASSFGNIRTTSARRSAVTTSTSASTATSSQKCFANYKECMETYCKREDAAYNRCFCSAKLAQIDSKYQKKIDSLIQEIIKLKDSSFQDDPDNPLTSVEDYWNDTVSEYTKTNPWLTIDDDIHNAMDKLNFADTETRVRGQNAFNIGHQYCVNYLHSCSYMESNLRDAYKSEITRDCAAYEETLQKIQTIAESVIENYNK